MLYSWHIAKINFDFGVPVIDFESGADSSVWVLVDAQWQSTAAQGFGPTSMIKVVTWTGVKVRSPWDLFGRGKWGLTIRYLQFVEMASNDVLLTSLNSACLLPGECV